MWWTDRSLSFHLYIQFLMFIPIHLLHIRITRSHFVMQLKWLSETYALCAPFLFLIILISKIKFYSTMRLCFWFFALKIKSKSLKFFLEAWNIFTSIFSCFFEAFDYCFYFYIPLIYRIEFGFKLWNKKIVHIDIVQICVKTYVVLKWNGNKSRAHLQKHAQ